MSGITGQFNEGLIISPGLRRLAHLPAFLPEFASVRYKHATTATDAVIGWGDSALARKAQGKAAKAHLPYVHLEDGFLRSVGLGEAGVAPLSIVADDMGLYFDATRPNRLEQMLEAGTGLDTALLARAAGLRAQLVQSGLSKTNMADPELRLDLPAASKRVLLVDQTFNDASIRWGLADGNSFDAMVHAARDEHPGAQLVIKTHPVVAAGLKQSCFSKSALQADDVILCADSVQPKLLFDMVDHVYVVTSLLGFEALLHGKPVTCFGAPFYAGWGATDDRVKVARRTSSRSVDEILAAAYLRYARYVDPVTGKVTTAEATADRLIWLRDRAKQNKSFHALVGFAPWKRRGVENLLYSPKGEVRFFQTVRGADKAARAHQGMLVVWAGREQGRVARALGKTKSPVLRMEDGFIRSQGLGAAFIGASSLVLDEDGIYFDPSNPSRLEKMLQHGGFDQTILNRAARLRASLIAAGLSKYNLWGEAGELANIPDGKQRLLVVGQVEDDASIRLGCGTGQNDIRTNAALLQTVRQANPDAFVIYKGHPDVAAGYRKGAIAPDVLAKNADLVVHDTDIVTCLSTVDQLHTMTSLSGFEALLRGVPVYTYGKPFYAGWGLTHDALELDRRTRQCSLDELVAATLINYPLYVHPLTGFPCEVEDVVDALHGLKESGRAGSGTRPSWLRRQRPFRYIAEILHPAPKVRY